MTSAGLHESKKYNMRRVSPQAHCQTVDMDKVSYPSPFCFVLSTWARNSRSHNIAYYSVIIFGTITPTHFVISYVLAPCNYVCVLVQPAIGTLIGPFGIAMRMNTLLYACYVIDKYNNTLLV